jgi:16S rRNA (cytosine967-C5)-methyltransferase
MPGDTILDACSGRGNKAWILGHAVGPTGAVDCADLYDAKIGKLMSGPVAQLVRKAFAIDWTVDGAGRDLEGAYDRVLVDAPCSGTGTLRRRPEIARGRTVEDLERLAELQLRILVTAARAAKVGGEIAYAVCSVLREEAEAVLEKACASDDVRLEVIGTPLRLLPHVDGTDGYFVARLRRG